MNVKRLLIADNSEVFAQELTIRLEGSFQIQSCRDGYMAQKLLDSFRPHVVVLDLMMPGMDGLALMRSINQHPLQPKLLVTTKFMTAFIEHTIHSISFDYLMFKPCEFGVLADRICEIAMDPCRDIIMPSLPRSRAADMLTALNVSANHKGFRYLQYGVELFSQDPYVSVTKTVYPAIGEHFEVRADAVERDIRRAIHAAWVSHNPNTWQMYFTRDCSGYIPRPTNTTFIATLAQRLASPRMARAE